MGREIVNHYGDERLETSVVFDGVALAEEIREACGLLLESKGSDPEFRARLKASFDRARADLAAIVGGSEIADALGDPNELLNPPT